MGMSASQARYLGLAARRSNIEYHGQQINQERTILSQQCTALYNSLLDLQVPTPPSTSDYTKVVYSGHDGATSFEIGSIIPHRDSYSIDFKYQKTGHYIEEAGQAAVIATPTLKFNTIIASGNLNTTGTYYDATTATTGSTTTTDGNTIMEDKGPGGASFVAVAGTDYYILTGGRFVKITDPSDANYTGITIYAERVADSSSTTIAATDYDLGASPTRNDSYNKNDIINEYYIIEGTSYRTITDNDFGDPGSSKPFIKLDDGTYIYNSSINPPISLAKKSDAEAVEPGTSGAYDPKNTDMIGIVAGKDCYRLRDAVTKGLISTTSIDEYIEAIRNALPEYADKEEYTDDDIKDLFGVYCTRDSSTGRLVPHFVVVQEVVSHIGDANDTHFIPTYDYLANGRFDAVENKKDCLLEFDVQGRITSVKVPTYNDDGTIATYKTISLSAEKQTDEEAYEEAYNKYEYAQHLYDKKQQEINQRTEIIQQEDRNLELKLTRLDNERKAIETEAEAVKKVIDDNIDKTFKTFSG